MISMRRPRGNDIFRKLMESIKQKTRNFHCFYIADGVILIWCLFIESWIKKKLDRIFKFILSQDRTTPNPTQKPMNSWTTNYFAATLRGSSTSIQFCLTLGGHICLILGISGQAHLNTRPKDRYSHHIFPIIKIPWRKDKTALGIAYKKKFQLRSVSSSVCAIQWGKNKQVSEETVSNLKKYQKYEDNHSRENGIFVSFTLKKIIGL